jgi:hypothetical protein
MRQIEILPQIKIISEYRGKSFVYLIFTSILFFLIGGPFMAYDGLNGKYINIFFGVFMFFLSVMLAISMFKRGVYKPEKSFSGVRIQKDKVNKYNKYAAVVLFLFCLIMLLLDVKQGIKTIGYSIAGFVGLYYLSKSIKFHEDIDYETNEFLAEIVGLNIDEKIVASYQNFDSSKAARKKNDNLIIVTNRKVFFAVFNGTNWMTLNKLLSEIQKIGIARNDVNSYLKLVFADNTSLGLRLDLYEKITTTPQLFVKQFLSTLDASLMGYDVVSSNNRRRVSISQENASVDNNSSNQKRSIELNQTLVNELKTSEEIKSGRILEI